MVNLVTAVRMIAPLDVKKNHARKTLDIVQNVFLVKKETAVMMIAHRTV